jgi:hypothetical protein
MGWWFGRKGAPEAMVCGYSPPPWLTGAHEEGFARSTDGLSALVKSSGERVAFVGGTWELGHVRAAKVSVGGDQVLGARLGAVADPTGGTVTDVEARAAIAAILARLRTHGLIAA